MVKYWHLDQDMKNKTYIFFPLCSAQHIAHEIVDTSRPGCPPEYMNIPVPKGKEDKYNYKYIPFTRSNYHSDSGRSPNTPRQQVRIYDFDSFIMFYCLVLQCSKNLQFKNSLP